MGSFSVNLLGHPVIATKYTPTFSFGKVGRNPIVFERKHNSCPSLEFSPFRPSRMTSSLSSHNMGSGAHTMLVNNCDGIGIVEFLRGKNLFITGGTGFLAKVLIEKILRTNADVGKIYVMVKANGEEEALKRLQTEVVDTDLFKCLRDIHGKDYHDFVARKLIPVIGDISQANLGIERELANEIMEVVDIIVHSAGNTNFHERYDVALDINTLGPLRIMSFAQRFQRLKLLLHVSTAYVNGMRRGVVLEKPFRLGDTITTELGTLYSSDPDNTILDIKKEIKLAFDLTRRAEDTPLYKDLKDLGLQRAKLHGWTDTYTFTKAMGEMVVNCVRGEIPVVVIRPSIIESTLKEPFPGWIEGIMMIDPVLQHYGKGQIKSFLGDPNNLVDVIPVDMVVNAMLASMAKHGGERATVAGLHVYHIASSTVNPLSCEDMSQHIYQHFTQSPFINAAGKPIRVKPIQFCNNMEQYVRTVRQGIEASEGLSDRARERIAKYIIYLGRVYEPYVFYNGRFDNTNTEALHVEMSTEEQEKFQFDVRNLDWMDYFTNVHIPGFKQHVLKGPRL